MALTMVWKITQQIVRGLVAAFFLKDEKSGTADAQQQSKRFDGCKGFLEDPDREKCNYQWRDQHQKGSMDGWRKRQPLDEKDLVECDACKGTEQKPAQVFFPDGSTGFPKAPDDPEKHHADGGP